MADTITKGLIGENDLKHYDGVTDTFNRPTSTGGSYTLRKIGTEVDVIMAYGGGSSFTRASIDSAIDAIGSAVRCIVLRPGTWVIDDDLTIPSNISLHIVPGALLEISSGKTLTIAGNIYAGIGQIFSGSGTVSFSSATTVYPEWWGATGDGTTDDDDAIQAALGSGARNICFTAQTYIFSSTISPDDNQRLFSNHGSTLEVDGSESTTFALLTISGKEHVTVDGLTLDGNQTTRKTGAAVGGAFIQSGSRWCRLINVTVQDCGILPANTPSLSTGTGSGNGITISSEESDDADSEYNEIIGCTVNDPSGQLAFGIRLWTDWTINQAATDYTHYCQKNIIKNCTIIGTTFNAIEIAGPATLYNTIDSCKSIGLLGNTGIEADKGASYSTFSNNIVTGATWASASNYNDSGCYRNQGTIGSGYPDRYCIGNVFTNNIAHNNGVPTSQQLNGMIVDYSKDLVISGMNIGTVDADGDATDQTIGIHLWDAYQTVIDSFVFHPSDDTRANYGVLINDTCEYVHISNSCLYLTNASSVGVRITADIEGLIITGTDIINGLSGIQLSTPSTIITDGIISNCYFKDQTYAPINFVGIGTVLKGVISGCVVETTGSFAIRSTEPPEFLIRDIRSNVAILSNTKDRAWVAGNMVSTMTDSRWGSGAIKWGSAAPTDGTWVQGDIVYNYSPSAGEWIGWVCTESGTPGTWKGFGVIDS